MTDAARACADALRRRLVTQYRTYRALRRTARAMHLAENRPPEVEAPEGSLWRLTTCLKTGCWCRPGSLEGRVHGAAS